MSEARKAQLHWVPALLLWAAVAYAPRVLVGAEGPSVDDDIFATDRDLPEPGSDAYRERVAYLIESLPPRRMDLALHRVIIGRLEALGPAAEPQVVAALGRDSTWVNLGCLAVLEGLECRSEVYHRALLDLLGHPDTSVRRTALGALCRLAPEATTTYEALMQALWWFGTHDLRASPLLGTLASHHRDAARAEVVARLRGPTQRETGTVHIRVLGHLGGPRALSALLELLSTGSPWQRREALAALGQVGGDEAVEAIMGASADPDPSVRRWVPKGLERLGGDQGRRLLRGLIRDLDQDSPDSPAGAEGIRDAAFRSLLVIGAPEDGDLLREWVRSRAGDEGVEYYLHDLANIEGEHLVPFLRELAQMEGSEHPRVRWAVAKVLGVIENPAAWKTLSEFLLDDDPMVVGAARFGLTNHQPARVRAYLVEGLLALPRPVHVNDPWYRGVALFERSASARAALEQARRP